MRKRLYGIFAMLLLLSAKAEACTNFIVGKDASDDGSVICSYNADDYGSFMSLCHYPAATHKKGEMRKIIDWDTQKYLGEIPEIDQTFNVIGNMNEFQVTIGETTYGGREEMVDTTGLIDYGSLIYIALQRSKTARQAISVMTGLTEKYGYCSEGESFTICDKNEAWILEMQGCGGDKDNKVVWVAVRIPDNAISGHANQARIGRICDYQTMVMHSTNLIPFARKKGWFTGNNNDFNWKETFAKPDFEGRRFCDARVWSFLNHFANVDAYLPWALGKDPNAKDMPLYIIPDKKVSVRDIMACMRDHYEGTALSVANGGDLGGGIWQMPYRPTPLVFKIDGKEYFNERPTSTQQTAFTFVAQMRAFYPDEVGGVLWFGNDDPNMIAYTPIYCNSTKQPKCYNTPGADALTYSDDNAYWLCNSVSNIVYPRYSLLFKPLEILRDSLEDMEFKEQRNIEERAYSMSKSNKKEAISYLMNQQEKNCDKMMDSWKKLRVYLTVKFNDMTIKPEKNGKFTRTKEGLGSKVIRPGYPESYAKELIKQTGDKFVYPTKKK